MLSINNIKYKNIIKAVEYFDGNNISITKCANIFNIHRGTLSKYLREYDLYQDRRKYEIDEKFFSTIDSEEKAYWLGFILADGCLKSKINQLSIRLSIKDLAHLEKFKSNIKSNHPIKIEKSIIANKSYDMCVLRIQNQKIYNDLLELNIKPNKSMKEKYTFIKQDLLNHYIRGIFDGDGWITWNSNSAEIGIGMGKEILIWIKNIFEAKLNLKEYPVKAYKNIYRYRVSSKYQMKKILDYMYSESNLYLNRKYNKYLDFCRLELKPQKTQDY